MSCPGAIAALFHDDDVAFGAAALAAYAAAAFALAALTYGVAVPSGLFVPSILIGGALGRLAGEAYRALDLVPGGVHVRPGVWAVCGAAAVLAGVRAEIDRRFGTSRPNFEMLSLGRIDVDSADFWTDRFLSSSSRSTVKILVSKHSNTLTLKSI